MCRTTYHSDLLCSVLCQSALVSCMVPYRPIHRVLSPRRDKELIFVCSSKWTCLLSLSSCTPPLAELVLSYSFSCSEVLLPPAWVSPSCCLPFPLSIFFQKQTCLQQSPGRSCRQRAPCMWHKLGLTWLITYVSGYEKSWHRGGW